MVKSKREKIEKSKRARKIWKWVIWITVGLVLVGTITGFLIWWSLEGSKTDLEKRGLPDRGVPVMEISLADGLELSEIDGGSKETKYEGNEVTVYENGEAREYNDVEVKGRGNLSWLQQKKGYQIKLSEKTNLLGLESAKKWVLLSNYLDASYLRNDIALLLANMLEMRFNNRGDFIELYIDGDYRGLYYVVQRVEIAKGSVDLRDNNGVLFEMDMLHKQEGEECHETFFGECLILKDAVMNDNDNNSIAVDAFLEDLNTIEKAAREKKYETIAELMDVSSFVEYFLLNEFVVNPDSYSTSFYLYRNDNGEIAAGPAWDFDLALANAEWKYGDSGIDFFSPHEDMVRRNNAFGSGGLEEDLKTSKLIYYLMDMPEFKNEVKRVFQERMSGRRNELIQAINDKAGRIYVAAKADEERWGKVNFDMELSKIIEWIIIRYEHFENTYGGDEYGLSEAI